jgi:preprotein translocase subunit SecA
MLDTGPLAAEKPGVAPAGGAFLAPALTLYPEREEPRHHWLDPAENVARYLYGRLIVPVLRLRLRVLLLRTVWRARGIAALDDAGLDARIELVRRKARTDGLTDANLVEAFALIRETSRRILGLYHHKVQLLGALAMARGAVAEMETGEGKTLTATLTVGAAGLAGIPVHVVTVNDYLAERDAATMRPLFDRLGLSVGVLKHGIPPPERRRIYRRDIVYASNKEITFDYLRDRVKLGGPPQNAALKLRQFLDPMGQGELPVMRGLHFAIVDEADSVLIDEARTPLILSRETDAESERIWAETAWLLARQMFEGRHYKLHRRERRIELTDRGKARLETLGLQRGGIWANRIRREQAVTQALTARYLFTRGDQYIVSDGKVVIVDEYTGRIMEERSWNDGMHQLVEAKEGVEITPRKDVLARITYQRFFRRYRHLAGMTGTAREVASELSTVYRLNVVSIPTNARSKRRFQRMQLFPTAVARWRAVAERALALSRAGRPVLIGTRSVEASEQASEHLHELGVEHDLLNARNEAEEAEIIARAGEAGRVTVATNMAGRGVDIALGEGVAERGGLHVILTERHDSKRIDRQLVGRTARRGEPGSSQPMLSLQDGILEHTSAGKGWLATVARMPGGIGRLAARILFRRAQKRAERNHARARRILLDQDRRLGTMLAFSGKPE